VYDRRCAVQALADSFGIPLRWFGLE
jgi:hypothetical protein